MPSNVLNVNDIRATGATVVGKTILSGNSLNNILEVTGSSGTNVVVTDDSTSNLLWGISGTTGAVVDFYQNLIKMYVDLNLTGSTIFDGDFAATSKSFDIPHPTQEGYRLRYGVLEGPEHAVYHRGRTTSSIIKLPEYWDKLVDNSTISVNLTSIGNNNHWIEKFENNQVYIASNNGLIDCFYIIYAERKDIEKIILEYKKK